MTAQDAAVAVHLINNHIAQLGEKIAPVLVVSKYRQVQHFRIAQQHPGQGFTNFPPPVTGGVAVKKGRNVWMAMLDFFRQPVKHGIQHIFLVLCQGL